jgi:hypothetical protein
MVGDAEPGFVPGALMQIVKKHLGKNFDAADTKADCYLAGDYPGNYYRVGSSDKTPGYSFGYGPSSFVHIKPRY